MSKASRKLKLRQLRERWPIAFSTYEGTLRESRNALEHLAPTLPEGWQTSFSVRRTGTSWGLNIKCSICGCRPPKEVPYHLRWRWLSVHATMATCKPVMSKDLHIIPLGELKTSRERIM